MSLSLDAIVAPYAAQRRIVSLRAGLDDGFANQEADHQRIKMARTKL
jgi:hypothetical protein